MTEKSDHTENSTSLNEAEEENHRLLTSSSIYGTNSFDMMSTRFPTPEDGPMNEMYGEDAYIPEKKTEYISGLSRFAWMRPPPVDIEKNTTLTHDKIQNGLSRIGRAIDSTEMAFLKFEARSKQLDKIDCLSKYRHVRNVDLSDNRIKSLAALAPLKYLQVLNVPGNAINSFDEIPHFIWLQALNLKKNDLESLDGIHPNYLAYLNLSNNHISSQKFFIGDIFPNLLTLELRGNKFTSIAGIELPKLRHLYLAQNLLTDLNGIENCPELEHIHARENKIKSLASFPNLKKLKYINLRNNAVRRFSQTAFLSNSEGIQTVVLMENPICESERYRSEIMAAVLSIKRLDKTIITELEMIDGHHLHTGRNMNLIPPLEDDYTIATPPPQSQPELTGEGDAE